MGKRRTARLCAKKHPYFLPLCRQISLSAQEREYHTINGRKKQGNIHRNFPHTANMKKKIVCLILSLFCLCGTTACNIGGGVSSQSAPEERQTTQEDCPDGNCPQGNEDCPDGNCPQENEDCPNGNCPQENEGCPDGNCPERRGSMEPLPEAPVRPVHPSHPTLPKRRRFPPEFPVRPVPPVPEPDL